MSYQLAYQDRFTYKHYIVPTSHQSATLLITRHNQKIKIIWTTDHTQNNQWTRPSYFYFGAQILLILDKLYLTIYITAVALELFTKAGNGD